VLLGNQGPELLRGGGGGPCVGAQRTGRAVGTQETGEHPMGSTVSGRKTRDVAMVHKGARVAKGKKDPVLRAY